MYLIKNEFFQLEVEPLGAQIISFKRNGDELIWNDFSFWSSPSPLLFPNIGTLNNDYYIYKDQKYHLNQHGFIMKSMFKVREHKENSITLEFTSNAETLKQYPFLFSFKITYELINENLEVSININNLGNETMFFNVGLHPAFNYSALTNNFKVSVFPSNCSEIVYEKTNVKEIKDVNVSPFSTNDLNKKFEINSTVCYTNVNNIKIESDKYNFDFTGNFSTFAFWGIKKDGKGFLCLEPWSGTPDLINNVFDIEKKTNLLKLKSNEEYNYNVKINVRSK